MVLVFLGNGAVVAVDAVDQDMDGLKAAPAPRSDAFRAVSLAIERVDALGRNVVGAGSFGRAEVAQRRKLVVERQGVCLQARS